MSRHRHHKPGFQWSLWGAPIVLGIVSIVGLVSGLMDDGLWDVVSWIGLGIPFAACLWYGLPLRRRRRSGA